MYNIIPKAYVYKGYKKIFNETVEKVILLIKKNSKKYYAKIRRQANYR
jgi:hypothetical protein